MAKPYIFPSVLSILSLPTGSGDFEREAECGNDECGFEGEMEFVATGTETAEAECPECGDTVEIYTAD